MAASETPIPQTPTGQQSAISDAHTTAILTAVEQQLTRYFSAMAARADAVQQSSDAGRAELVHHFQQQIDVLRGELEQSREENDNYERALQTAIEDRLTEFASGQHWRFGEIEGRLERVSQEITVALPAQVEAATNPLQERFDRTTEMLASRIEELQKAARRFDEQSSALVHHVNSTTTTLSQQLDDAAVAFSERLDERSSALGQRVDESLNVMRTQVAEQVNGFTRKLDESDARVVDRMLSMEERINEQTGSRLAAVEATIGRISSGIDEAIVALSHRVIELENDNLGLLGRLDEIAEKVNSVDDDAINQLREQMSSAIGESMLVRIELERVASSTGEQFDKINVRVAELAAEISDTELDVTAAIQLERLEEIERALIELDPAQFVRKVELDTQSTRPSASSAPSSADTDPSESNLSSW